MTRRILLGLRILEAHLRLLAIRTHLTTDPACRHYVAPKPGSRLDRLSRGFSCDVCLPPTPPAVTEAMIAAYLEDWRGRHDSAR